MGDETLTLQVGKEGISIGMDAEISKQSRDDQPSRFNDGSHITSQDPRSTACESEKSTISRIT